MAAPGNLWPGINRSAWAGGPARVVPACPPSRSHAARARFAARFAEKNPRRRNTVAEERALLPNDYRAHPYAFDNFSERVATSARLRRYDIARLYRAHLAAEQMTAENIVQFTRQTPEVKLLVLLPDDAMLNPRDVADYVAQKTSARQLILDRSEKLRETHSKLLADLEL